MTCKNMKRLTTDTPKGCLEGMLNFAIAKDNKVFLADENGEYNVDLCEYVSKLAKAKGYDFSPEDIMEEGLFEYYQEDFSVLYCLAVQAAELRERLKMYEDKLENGTLAELPFVALINQHLVNGKFVAGNIQNKNGKYAVVYSDKSKWGSPLIDICGKKAFDKEEVEERLKELKENG